LQKSLVGRLRSNLWSWVARRDLSVLSSLPLFQNQVNARKTVLLTGKATEQGTKEFVRNSSLPTHHQFKHSGLYVTPVLHGAPSIHNDDDQKYIELLLTKAVLENRSNGIVVYEHMLSSPSVSESESSLKLPYHVSNLAGVLQQGKLTRDQVVTIANLGSPASSTELVRRLTEARTLSHLEFVDFAYFEVQSYESGCIVSLPIPFAPLSVVGTD
jgi:hypothetical protein